MMALSPIEEFLVFVKPHLCHTRIVSIENFPDVDPAELRILAKSVKFAVDVAHVAARRHLHQDQHGSRVSKPCKPVMVIFQSK